MESRCTLGWSEPRTERVFERSKRTIPECCRLLRSQSLTSCAAQKTWIRAISRPFSTGKKMLLLCKRQILLTCLMTMGCICCFASSLCSAGAEDQNPAADKKTLNEKVKEIAG